MLAEKLRLAWETWADLFGPLDHGRFAKRVKPLFQRGVLLGQFERAARAYRDDSLHRSTALEWFVNDFQRWLQRANASPLEEWGGYARAALITDPEQYRQDYLTRLAAEDAAREPLEPAAAPIAEQPSLPL